MTLRAYAVQRTFGALLVFLLVVLLTQFAVANADRAPIRSIPEHIVPSVDSWTHVSENWAMFPAALGALGLAFSALVVRRLASR